MGVLWFKMYKYNAQLIFIKKEGFLVKKWQELDLTKSNKTDIIILCGR
jgi:hypothetical protein